VVAAVAAAKEVADEGGAVVLRQDRVVLAFAPTAVKEHPINWAAPVMNSNVPIAERP
jgi:hypothetical protein